MTQRIVFLGSKSIGYFCLRHLIKNSSTLKIEVIGIFSNDNIRFDTKSNFKQLAEENKIPFFCDAKDLFLISTPIDFLISVQYHEILKNIHICLAKKWAINLHMAPLPEYRGCNQFSFAIYNKHPIFGTTIHIINEGIDAGDILAERRFPISQDMMVKDLYDRTIEESKILFEENIEDILAQRIIPVPQASLLHSRKSKLYLRKDIKQLKEIDLGDQALDISNKVNATSMPGFEPAFTVINGMKYYIIPEKYFSGTLPS